MLEAPARSGRRFDREPVGKGEAMVMPRRMARFNRVVFNPAIRPLARVLPGLGVVIHRGRRSGHLYRTPVNVFRAPDGYVIALTYGIGDWVRNVLAAGHCELETRGRRVRLVDPRVAHDPDRRKVPPGVRPILRLIGVADFLHLRAANVPADR
jgi:deazaflavin-dependent oxidoreductase (nitroreductase family)